MTVQKQETLLSINGGDKCQEALIKLITATSVKDFKDAMEEVNQWCNF